MGVTYIEGTVAGINDKKTTVRVIFKDCNLITGFYIIKIKIKKLVNGGKK